MSLGQTLKATAKKTTIRVRLFPPGKCDGRSYRNKRFKGMPEKTYAAVCCPTGEYSPSRKRCKVGTQVQSIIVPIEWGKSRAKKLARKFVR